MKLIVLITLADIQLAFFITAGGCANLDRKTEKSRDVAVTNMSAPSSCAQGDTVPVVVSIANQGNQDESFNITLTDVTDGKEIGTQSISLPCKGSLMNETCDLTFTGANVGDTAYTTNTGDIDGDNYADLLVGAMNYNSSQGRAYLYYGGPNMDNQADLIFNGEADSHFGWMQGVGDVDNDSYDDIVITGGTYNNDQGRAYLYWGGPRATMDNQADLTFNGEPGAASYFGEGWNNIVVKDIDGDGYADIVVPSMQYSSNQGRAYLYWGGARASMNAICDLTFTPTDGGGHFGVGMACGDIDKDGYKDIVIGAKLYGGIGRAYLYWGAAQGSMDAICDLTFNAPAAGQFGDNVGIGDVDNDNYADVLIGSYRYGTDQGRAYLYWGSARASMNATCDHTFTGEDISRFGEICIADGDVNSDGYADILIGASRYDTYRGRAYIFYGDTKDNTILKTSADKTFDGENANDWFGDPQGGNFGDFDNDGYDDVVIGARMYPGGDETGRVYLYYGGPSSYSTEVSFDWDTIRASTGEHTLKAEIVPVAGEEDTADNTMTTTVNVKSKVKEK